MTTGAPQASGGGVPRLFSVAGTASPLPATRGLRTIEHTSQVALRTAPQPDQAFPVRAARGVFVPGMLFALACEGAYDAGRVLVRVLSVSDTPSVNFQLVMAQLVQPAETSIRPAPTTAPVAQPITAQVIDGEVEGIRLHASLLQVSDTAVTFTTAADLYHDTMLQVVEAAQPGVVGAVLRVVRVQGDDAGRVYAATFEHAARGAASSPATSRRPAAAAPQPADDGGRRLAVSIPGTATAVAIDGVATIAAEISVTITSPVEPGIPLELSTARGAITAGDAFVLRFYHAEGARRGLVRATDVRPQPGMIDAVHAVLLRESVPAPEAASYRVQIDRFFRAEVVGQGQRQVTGRLWDISAGGVGLQIGDANVGDRLRFRTAGSTLPGLDGAEIVVVRRDPRDPQRFGARFTEPGRGQRALATILDADRAERDRLREAKKEATRRGRKFAETAMIESLGRAAEGDDEADDVRRAG